MGTSRRPVDRTPTRYRLEIDSTIASLRLAFALSQSDDNSPAVDYLMFYLDGSG